MKTLGDATYYLGIQNEKEADGSHLLNQKQKTIDLIDTLGLKDVHSIPIPMQAEFLEGREERYR